MDEHIPPFCFGRGNGFCKVCRRLFAKECVSSRFAEPANRKNLFLLTDSGSVSAILGPVSAFLKLAKIVEELKLPPVRLELIELTGEYVSKEDYQ